MYLLTETTHGMELLTEQSEKGKTLYIQGVFMTAEKLNRNRRVYPKRVLEQAVEVYQREYVRERRAIGELNHPDYPLPDPAQAAIIVESLEWQGNDVIGKARVLNTPKGQIVAALLEGGFNLGVSTRALGEVSKMPDRAVVEKLVLNAVDAVDRPSNQTSYVDAIYESMPAWINENGVWTPAPATIATIAATHTKLDESQFMNALDKFLVGMKERAF